VNVDAVVVTVRRAGQDAAGDALAREDVRPGEMAVLRALVRNQSGIVDNYRIGVEGIPETWVLVSPPTVYLVPYGAARGAYEQEVEIQVRPPRTPEAEAREWPIRVTAASATNGSIVGGARAIVNVLPYAAFDIEVEPQVRRARRQASYGVAVRNRGNAATNVTLAGTDAEGACTFAFEQPTLQVPRGGRVATALHVRPPKQIFIGKPTDRRLEIVAAEAGAAAAPAGPELPQVPRQVVFNQRPWLPTWIVPIVMAVLVATGALAVLRPKRAKLVKVPNVVAPVQTDKPEAQTFDVQKLLEAKGLKLGKAQPRNDPTSPAGAVLDQSPPPGTKVKPGSQITIIYAQHPGQAAQVPDLTGLTLKAALPKLAAAHLALGEVSPASATIDPERDKIVVTDPVAGTQATAGAQVKVFFKPPATAGTTSTPGGTTAGAGGGGGGAGGTAAGAAVVAGLVGQPLAAAVAAAQKKGITLSPVRRISAAAPNTVVADARNGAPAPGGGVTVAVSAGYPPIVLVTQGRLLAADGAKAGKAVQVTPQGVDASAPSFSPDGRQLAYSGSRDGTHARIFLHAIPAQGKDQPATEAGSFDTDPAISPDGKTLAFVRSSTRATLGTQAKLCFVALQAGALSACVTDAAHVVRGPVWSADGRTVVVRAATTADPGGSSDLLAFTSPEASSSDPTIWTPAGASLTAAFHGGRKAQVLAATFSPLANPPTLAVVANWQEDGVFRVYLLALDGTAHVKTRTPLGLAACAVDWRRPDAKELLLVTSTANCGSGGDTAVVRVAANGSGAQQQLVSGATVLGVAWQPLPSTG
jgi:hypothetical protein